MKKTFFVLSLCAVLVSLASATYLSTDEKVEKNLSENAPDELYEEITELPDPIDIDENDDNGDVVWTITNTSGCDIGVRMWFGAENDDFNIPDHGIDPDISTGTGTINVGDIRSQFPLLGSGFQITHATLQIKFGASSPWPVYPINSPQTVPIHL